MKKIISSFLIMVLVLTGTKMTSHASVDNRMELSEAEIQLCVQMFFDDFEHLASNQNCSEDLYIGNPISTYTYTNTGEIQRNNNRLYPFFLNSEISFLVFKSDDGTLQITQCYINELNKFYDKEIAIIFDSEKCYIWNETDTILKNIDCFDKIIDRGNLNERRVIDNMDVVKVEATKKVSISTSQRSSNRGDPINPIVILSVPIVNQGAYTNLCWAACVKSIGQYMTGRIETIETIARYVNGNDTNYNQTAYMYEATDALHHFYGVNFYYDYYNPPTDGTIHGNVSSGYPLYGYWVRSNGAHAMVIRGINRNAGSIYIMDPKAGNATVTKSNGVYRYLGTDGVYYTLDGYAAYQ